MKSILLFFLLTVLIGCKSSNTDAEALAEFAAKREAGVTFSTTLGPGDVIKFAVEVDGLEQVAESSIELNENGIGTFPLVGDIWMTGLTRSAAKARLEKAYRALYVNPPMISFSVEYGGEVEAWGYVTVLGRVSTPGRVAISSPEGIYLSEAIKLAGGFALGAKRNAVKVSRIDDDGKKLQAIIDFKRIADTGDASADIELQAGDMVFIPERLF